MTADFWQDPGNHLAAPPSAPRTEMASLADFVRRQGWRGRCLFQTSGSEGRPKWVVLSKQALLISAEAVNAHFAITAQDRWRLVLPLHHVGGFAILARAHMAGCRVTHLEGKWDPPRFAEAGDSLSSLVPTQVHDLVRAGLRAPDGLRAVIVGGGAITPELVAAARELGWPLFLSYGLTEASSQVATQAWPAGTSEALQVLPHWQASTDAEGRLRLRGPSLAAGHVLATDDHGWQWQPIDPQAGLLTRDRVRLENRAGHTWLHFEGRESGWVKILGELIHLAPLQARLEALALEAHWPSAPVLLARPDPRAETALVLVVEGEPPEAQALLDRFHAGQPPWLRIQRVVSLPQLPRSDLGKIRLAELEQLLGR